MIGANFLVLFTLGLLSSSIANAIPTQETSTTQPIETVTVVNDDPDFFYGDSERLTGEDKTVRALLATGLTKYSKVLDEQNKPIVVEVIRARREFFNELGEYVYTIQAIIGESNCPRGTTETDTCQLIGRNNRECYFEIYEKSWRHRRPIRMECEEETVANS